MRTVTGGGSWPGTAEGRIVWLEGLRQWDRTPVGDRAAELLRFRAEVARALSDVEAWSERQPTVEARLVLQRYRDALLEEAWVQRAAALIDGRGLPAAAAAVEAAQQVAAVVARDEALEERAAALVTAAAWLGERLAPRRLPVDAVLAAHSLNALQLLDRVCPAITGDGEPVIRADGPPLVWGVPHLGPHWNGRRVAIDGPVLTMDVPEPGWWHWNGDTLGGVPVCYLKGSPDVIRRMAARINRRPVAMVRRLDDLAAVPVFVSEVDAVAVDLDRLGPPPRLRHPGLLLLMRNAARAAQEAGVPFLAGGAPVEKRPDDWAALGFTGFFTRDVRKGRRTDAVPRGQRSGM